MTIQIACPKCGSVLRLRDSRRLGQTGKCPQCEHRFVLRQPDEVELELVEHPAAQAPVVGTAAKWVPDNVTSKPTAAEARAELPGFTPPVVDPARMARARRKKARRKSMLTAGAVCLLMALAGGVFALRERLPKVAPVVAAAKSADEPQAAEPAAANLPEGDSNGDDSPSAEAAEKFKPIELLFVPSGARLIVNVRPAELLKAGGLGEGEFLACLGPVGTWLAASLKDLCQEDPAKIEEALICLIPTGRDTPPDVSVVVHLAADAKKSELIEKFGGERKEDLSRVYYASEDKAYLLHDLRTYAIAPATMAEEMVRAAEYSNPTDTGIEQLLPHTDRERMLSVVFIPSDLKLYEQVLFPETARPLLRNVVDWLANDDEVEGVAWSIDFKHGFSSRLLLRNAHIVRLHQLEKAFEAKLGSTPHGILDAVRQMNPPEVGKRHVIGRVPAMSKVVALSTKLQRGERYLALVTDLPERAGANLALGTLLAWDESTRTDFNKGPANKKKDTGGQKVPDLITDRFKTKIDVDFRREPLFSAFEYIAGEAKFNIIIEGDALKLSQYTKNMPQTFKMDGAPAGDALQEILKQYKEMAIVVDEQKKQVTVATLKFCEDKGLKPFVFKK
jgi:uncharacterized Zn finger protein (UPF0148 family)